MLSRVIKYGKFSGHFRATNKLVADFGSPHLDAPRQFCGRCCSRGAWWALPALSPLTLSRVRLTSHPRHQMCAEPASSTSPKFCTHTPHHGCCRGTVAQLPRGSPLSNTEAKTQWSLGLHGTQCGPCSQSLAALHGGSLSAGPYQSLQRC